MRFFALGLLALLGACATAPAGVAADRIEVVNVPGAIEYSIEDGGRGHMTGADNDRVFDFASSHADFQRIARLLAPLQAEGLACASPPETMRPGYIVWKRNGAVLRRVPMHSVCFNTVRPLAANVDDAWHAMVEMGRARYVAPTIPAPETISVEYMYWGALTSSWSVSRSGEGRYTTEGGQVQMFAVSAAQFEEIREIFRPYESRYFECNRAIYDGPYGAVLWSSREGVVDQRTRFDGGCVTGDADDLFGRLRRADALIAGLRAGPAN